MSFSKKDQPYTSKLRGVSALLGEATAATTQFVRIEALRLPSQQPRRYFDPNKLEQLVLSVKEHGILEPLLVRPLQQGDYELVAGERRYRAAQTAGLAEVPVVIRELSDEEALQLALIENLQREDLNPVEETEGILQLLAIKLGCISSEVAPVLYQMKNAVDRNSEMRNNVVPHPESQEEQQVKAVFEGLGLMNWVSFTTHRLPLLNLPNEILEALRQGRIAYTKAQAIARVKNEKERQAILEAAISKNLSLTEIKERIVKIKASSTTVDNSKPASLKNQMDATYRLVKKSKIWNNPKKQKQLEKLLAELEKLASRE